MSEKQLFASLEITGHEVRLIVGEFFNTRFNIIKVERVPCAGLSNNAVENPEEIIASIRKVSADAQKMIGSRVERVILAIPSVRMHRYSVKSTVSIQGINSEITVEDIRRAIHKAQSVNIGKEYALIQADCVKYTINGISSRRIPLGERAQSLTVDIDLLCADRRLAFDLVGCVEKAGLAVMDLYLDVFAVAKEAALFEQSVDQNVVILKMERQATTLGLLAKGRLNSAIIAPIGMSDIAMGAIDTYGLERPDAIELIKYGIRLDEKVYSNSPAYVWQSKGEAKSISEKEIVHAIWPKVQQWIEDMGNLCQPILQAGKTTVIITGEGGEMQGMDSLLRRHLKCEVRNYVPEILGGRNAGLTACLGLFYAYKDRLPITGFIDSSLDMESFIRSVSYRENRAQGKPEDTITNKLKGILFDGKK